MTYTRSTLAALLIAAAACARSGADPRGTAILKQSFATLHAARTYRAKVVRTDQQGRLSSEHEGVILAMKPNYMKYQLGGRMGATFVSDGKSYYIFARGGQFYQKLAVEAHPTEFPGEWEGEIDAFFGGAALVDKVQATYAGATRFAGKPCDLVRAAMKDPDRTVLYTIGRSDHLIYRASLTITQNGRSVTQTNTLSEIKLNGPMRSGEFRFIPAEGMREAPARPAPPRDRIGL